MYDGVDTRKQSASEEPRQDVRPKQVGKLPRQEAKAVRTYSALKLLVGTNALEIGDAGTGTSWERISRTIDGADWVGVEALCRDGGQEEGTDGEERCEMHCE